MILCLNRLAVRKEEPETSPEAPVDKVRSYVLSFPQSFAVSVDAPPETVCLQVRDSTSIRIGTTVAL